LKQAHRQFENKFFESTERATNLELELRETKIKKTKFQIKLAELQGARTKLKEELRAQESKQQKTDIELTYLQETSKAKIAKVESKLNASSSRIKDLEGQVIDIESKLDEAEEFIQNKDIDLPRRDRQLSEEKLTVQKMKEELDEADRRELEYDPENLRKCLDKEIADHQASAQRIESEFVSRDKLAGSLEAKVKNLEIRLESESAVLAREGAAYEGFRKELVKKEAKIAELENTLKENRTVAEGLQEEVEEKGAKIGELEATLQVARSTSEGLRMETGEKAAKITILENSLKQLENEYLQENSQHRLTEATLVAERSAYSSTSNKLSNAESKAQSWSTSYSILKSNTEQQISKLNDKISSLNTKLGSARAQGSYMRCVVKKDIDRLLRVYKGLWRFYRRYKKKEGGSFIIRNYPSDLSRRSDGKWKIEFERMDEDDL
jgi:chromosome segregation ATPase